MGRRTGRAPLSRLSEPAINLLNRLPHLAGTDLVFPSVHNQKLSDMSLTAVVRRIGVDATVHGLRSTFRDLLPSLAGTTRS